MNESYLKINKKRTVINLCTALFFALFIAYHIYLAVENEAGRIGRMVGLISFFLFAVAAILALIPRKPVRILRTVLMIAGLFLNFTVRLVYTGPIFSRLDFANTPSVLNCAVYVFSQLAILLLLIYYLVFRHNRKLNSKRKTVIILMTLVIVLFAACFVMECVLLMKYRMNIDLSRRFTVISRFLYCMGFVSMAVNFMLPVQKKENPNDMPNQPTDDELLFSHSESSAKNARRKNHKMNKHKNKHLPLDDELLFSHSESSAKNARRKNHKMNKHKKKHLPPDYDNDFVL